jgi:long-chain acyl-CoA synthetase
MNKDLNSNRREVLVSKSPPLNLSVIEISPPRPKQTLVFLHGLGADSLQWKAQLDYFGRDYRVIAIDLRGHGKSDPPSAIFEVQKSAAEIQASLRFHRDRRMFNIGGHEWSEGLVEHLIDSPNKMQRFTRISLDVLLKDVEAALKILKIKIPFVLIGHSLGGAIAAEYGRAHSYNLKHLILLNTPAKFRLSPLTALAFNLPAWLSPLSRIWIDSQLGMLKQFHKRVLKYWNGSTTFRNLYVPTLFFRGRNRYYESSSLGDLKSKMPSAKEIFLPRTSLELNREIEKFIISG